MLKNYFLIISIFSLFSNILLANNLSMSPIMSYLLDSNSQSNKKIFIIGDSTVRYDFDGNRNVDGNIHRTGWGSMLHNVMKNPQNVYNRARRGAISGGIEDNVNSYRRDAVIDEWIATHKGAYDYNNTKAFINSLDIQNGAFLLIQFGANDKYADISETDFKSYLQFYIDDARAMGLTPILITPINPKSTLSDTRAPYTQYIADLAADLNVSLIDLHTKSMQVFAKYTTQMRYDIFGAYKLDGTYDTTHLNRQGATIVATWLKDIACSQENTQDLCKQFIVDKSILIASAGEDKNITTEDILDLNASGLDSDGNITSYIWSEAGTELSNDRILQYSSNVTGLHVITLKVVASDGEFATDSLNIEVFPPQERIYEDAEDANTDGWGLYATTDGSTISNIQDDEKGNRVISLQGDNGLDNGFSFTNLDITDSTIVSWSMNYSEDFKFFVKVKTTSYDPLYIYYTPDEVSRGYEEIDSKKYIHVALGTYAKDGRWIHFTKDVEADLKAVFPDESIENIYGFYVRGSGKIDDIKTLQSAKITKQIYSQDTNITTASNVDMNISIYYQEENIKKPTIYFAAGGTINHKKYEHLIHYMVNEGYVIVAASYDDSFDSEHISDNFFEAFVKGWQMCEDKGINDDTRVGLVGHSSGAGILPSLAYRFFVNENMGENGRFIFGATPWVDFQYSNAMVLPKDTNFVAQWYEDDDSTDPRIYLDMYRHITVDNKTFITVKQNTNHSTIVNGTPLDIVEKTIYESLGNLAKYTFESTNKELIFSSVDIDNDNMLILKQNSNPTDVNYNNMMDKFIAAGSPYPCKSDPSFAANPREKECEAYSTQDIYPVDTSFYDVATASVEIPSYLQSYQEPVFDTTVRKITDRVNQTGNFHPYPKQGSAWNSDMTIIRMGYRLYDADTMVELPITQSRNNSQAYAVLGSPASGASDIRWSKTNPNLMYVLNSSQKYVKVELNEEKTDTNITTMIDFSSRNYTKVTTGNNEGNLDYDDRYIVFAAKKDNNDTVYAMLYQLEQTDVNWTKIVPHGLWDNDEYFDWISITPLGDSILLSANSHIYLYDINLSNEIVLENEASHGDMGIDVNGDPVYVQFIFSGEQGIWSYNLKTAQKFKLLPSKYNGGHITCRNYFHFGWCYVNTSQEGHKEIFALKLDNGSGTVRRFAQTHVSLQNRGCTQVNVSPDGSELLFASDWSNGSEEDYQYDADNYMGCTDEDRHVPIDTYYVKIVW